MHDVAAPASHKEKVCQEEACAESWDGLSPEVKRQCVSFVYCPLLRKRNGYPLLVLRGADTRFGLRLLPLVRRSL